MPVKTLIALIACLTLGGVISHALAFDAMYPKTRTGTIEIKQLPERTSLSTASSGSYYQRDNRLFSQLFNYIKANDVAMTVPVEAEVHGAEMRFFAGGDDTTRDLTDSRTVAVEVIPAREVVSVGLSGGYTEALFEKGKTRLEEWLRENPGYRATGSAYVVFWNGPYVPNPLKKSEVHLPITRATAGDQALLSR